MNKKDFMKAMSMIDDDLMRDADTVTKADTPEFEESVSGVEQYRRPVWQTVRSGRHVLSHPPRNSCSRRGADNRGFYRGDRNDLR